MTSYKSTIPGGERLINLAFALLETNQPLTFNDLLANKEIGYDTTANPDALERTFSRDKEALRNLGFPLAEDEGTYIIDQKEVLAEPLSLEPSESARLFLVIETMLSSPSFLLTQDLYRAAIKLGAASGQTLPQVAAFDKPIDNKVKTAIEALNTSGKLNFTYNKPNGESSQRSVFVDAIFTHHGHTYIHTRSAKTDQVRVFRSDRMSKVKLSGSAKKEVQTEWPENLSVQDLIKFPFQFGTDSFTAQFSIPAHREWRLPFLTRNKGSLTKQTDGSFVWSIEAADAHAAARWALSQAAHIVPVGPDFLVEAYKNGLKEVVNGTR